MEVGIYKIRRMMRVNGLRSAWKRKFVHTTDSKHDLPIAENVLNRQFEPEAANKAWVADITYIRTRSGWLYLAGTNWGSDPIYPALTANNSGKRPVNRNRDISALRLSMSWEIGVRPPFSFF